MSIKDSINNSVDLENRSPQSTKLFTKIAILASSLALLLMLIGEIAYKVDEIVGLNILASIFVPSVIMCLIAFYLAIAERLRAKYLGARVAIVLSCIVFVCIVALIIFELVTYGEIYIAPFNPPPVIKN